MTEIKPDLNVFHHTPDEHFCTLNYFNSDDGIWIICSCKWELNLGFWPTPEYAFAAVEQHREEKMKEAL